MSGDAEQEYFADGISEDIITDLSKVSALSVIARNTAFTFKGRNVAIREVARELEVSHVLEGSVRKAGNRVRITAQLIDGKAGDHVWAERFDRDLDDIFALQDEISGAIVKALRVKLLPEERKAIVDRGTSSPEAYDLYLRARALSGQFSVESLQRALALLREAIALDPTFFQACQELVAALANYVTVAPEHGREAQEEAREIKRCAEALAPNDPFVLAMRAQMLAQDGDFWNAEQVMEQTPEPFRRRLAPNAQFSVSFVGRFEEALRTFRERVQLDPLDRQVSWTFRDLLDITGRLEEAAAEDERGKDLPGARGFIELCALLRMKGRATPEELEAQYQVFMACRGPEERIPLFDQLAPVLLNPEAARPLVRRAIADPAYQDVTRMVWLSLLAGFYDATDDALAAIRRAYVDLDPVPHLLRFMWMPVLRGARKDARFKVIVRDLGLYEYWRKSGKWGDFVRPLGDDDFEIVG
jgi:TolB-like protein